MCKNNYSIQTDYLTNDDTSSRAEIFFANTTQRTCPVVRQILKSSSRSYTMLHITFSGIILVPAHITNKLFHLNILLQIIVCKFTTISLITADVILFISKVGLLHEALLYFLYPNQRFYYSRIIGIVINSS